MNNMNNCSSTLSGLSTVQLWLLIIHIMHQEIMIQILSCICIFIAIFEKCYEHTAELICNLLYLLWCDIFFVIDWLFIRKMNAQNCYKWILFISWILQHLICSLHQPNITSIQMLCNLIQIDFIKTENYTVFIFIYILVNVFADLYDLNHLNINVSMILSGQERTV